MEKYRITYVWKIIEEIVPNPGIEIATENENKRQGRGCKIPQLILNGSQAIKTLRESSCLIHGIKLFNCTPTEIRNIKSNSNEVRQVAAKFARPSEDRQPGPSSPGPSNSEKLQQYSSMEP